MKKPRATPKFLAGSLALFALPFLAALAAAADPPPPPPPPPPAPPRWVSHVTIGQPPAGCDTCPPVACEGRGIRVRVAGQFPDECWSVRRIELIPSPLTVVGPPTMRVVLDDGSCLGRVCLAQPTPWKADTVLPALPAGAYGLRLEIARGACADSFPPESLWAERIPFAVRSDCPPGEIVPFVDRVQIGRAPCDTCPPVVCADEPFPVTLSGVLPDNCVAFRGLTLVPVVNIRPGPPIVRATFAVNDCLDMPCTNRPQHWTATAVLPGLPAGGNGLTVESMQVSMCDSTRVLGHESAGLAFVVRDSCPPGPGPGPCLSYDWSPPAGPGACNATFVGDTASVDLRVASPLALAGLQGVLRTTPGLAVREIVPVGPAAGMLLHWTPRPGGAAFVMFATAGAPIPPYAEAPDDTAYRFAPVLRVGVRLVPVPAAPGIGPLVPPTLRADSLLGAGADGQAVPTCPLSCFDTPGHRCAPPIARFCAQPTCDVNHDGRADVSDLVRMVRCLSNGPSCPDTTARFDCDADGAFSIDDVICCAMSILRGRVPGGGGGRPEPSVALGFGEPVRDGSLLELPFTLMGADRVGAARVTLRFPADRYEVEGFVAAGTPGWLALHAVQDGELVIGLVATDATPPGTALPLALRLRLRPGADHGGEVVAQDAEVSAPDGAALATGIAGAGAVVDPGSAVAFSAVGPNPVSGEARFTLRLPRAADVDLAVHDLAGRRVATLHRGALAAGVHSFRWNGRTGRGEPARDGVYFVRLRAGDVEIARKTVLVRGH